MYRSRTILAVEDSEDDMFFLRRALKKTGLNPRLWHVSDGSEAMKYLSGTEPYEDRKECPIPDLVLLDIKLPRVNGFDVLNWVRRDPMFECLVVVVLSSSDEPGDVRKAYDLRANSYLTKQKLFGDEASRMTSLLHQYWLKLNICPSRG